MIRDQNQVRLNLYNDDQYDVDLYDLFYEVQQVRKSSEYLKYLNFLVRFKRYSIFNTNLVYFQKPNTAYFATRKEWYRTFDRRLKEDARPLVMLRPGGPVMFAYDISDTIGDDTKIPSSITNPFVVEGEINPDKLEALLSTIDYCKVSLRLSQDIIQKGGSVQRISSKGYVRFLIELNSSHQKSVNFQTLIHELAHIFCGHLGSEGDESWPDRRMTPKKSREFEAESVSYLVLARMGVKTSSKIYLANYTERNDQIPTVSFEAIIKSVEWIEKLCKGKQVGLFKPQQNER